MNQILLDSEYYKLWENYTHLKPTSVYRYTVELKKFEKYLVDCGHHGKLDFDKFYFFEESNEYAPIDKEFIDCYIDYLKNELNATKHILYDNIVYLRNFFGFLKSIKKIKSNPLAHYQNPFYERKLIDRSLSIDECQKLLKAALTNDPFFRQVFLLVLLMLTTGLRNREIRNLSVDQIIFDRNVIVVNKGQKTSAQVVYMTKLLKSELKRYLSHPAYKDWQKTGNQLVFFKDSKMLSSLELNKLVKSISQSAGITKNVTAHTFRHTTAYLMQIGGIDISIIQKQLRHVSIGTTFRYLPPLRKYDGIINNNALNIEKNEDFD